MEGFSAERDNVKTAGQIVVGKSFIFFLRGQNIFIISIDISFIINKW